MGPGPRQTGHPQPSPHAPPSARRPRVSKSPRSTTPGTPIPSTVNTPVTPSRWVPTDPTLLTATVCTPAPFDVELPVPPSVCTSNDRGLHDHQVRTILDERATDSERQRTTAIASSMFFFAAKRRTFSSVLTNPMNEQQSDEPTANRVQSLTS